MSDPVTGMSVCSRCGAERTSSGLGVCAGCALRLTEAEARDHSGEEALFLNDLPRGNQPVRRVGDFELIELLARGGMGAVYKARQRGANRLAAVKLLPGGAQADPELKRRFAREAQAGALQHPNIVAIYQVGEHEGQSFIAMEFVLGANLAELTRERPLLPRKAAEYVRAVAEAVHHAHEQGVVHRDLKPQNILIGSDDRPRVTDFGLARLAADASSLTLSGTTLGTPGYLPPEQATTDPDGVGVWSDVYSLGAVLYHLLTGRPPFAAASIAATLRQVIEVEPISPATLNSSVPRDLATICLKCLGKEPARRYGSSQALAEDLGRFLNDEPVRARPPGWWYLLQKQAKRHLAAFVSGVIVLAALIVALGVALWALDRERALRQVADEKTRQASEIAAFLGSVLENIRPELAGAHDTALLRQVLADAFRRLDHELPAQPLVVAGLRRKVGVVYDRLGDYENAATLLRAVLATQRAELKPDDSGLGETLYDLGVVLWRKGELEESERLLTEALAICTKTAGNADPRTAHCLNNLAAVVVSRGRYAEATARFRELLALALASGQGEREVLGTLGCLANALRSEDKLNEAEAIQRHCLAAQRRTYGEDHALVASSYAHLGAVLLRQGKADEAVAAFNEALARQRKLLGSEHPDVAYAHYSLGLARVAQERHAEAESQFLEAQAIQKKQLGDRHPHFALVTAARALNFSRQGQFAEAERLFREAVVAQREDYPQGHPQLALSVQGLARALSRQDRLDEAENLFREALAQQREFLGNAHGDLLETLEGLADVLSRRGRTEDARSVLHELETTRQAVAANRAADSGVLEGLPR